MSTVFCILFMSSWFVQIEAFTSNKRVGKRTYKVNIWYWVFHLQVSLDVRRASLCKAFKTNKPREWKAHPTWNIHQFCSSEIDGRNSLPLDAFSLIKLFVVNSEKLFSNHKERLSKESSFLFFTVWYEGPLSYNFYYFLLYYSQIQRNIKDTGKSALEQRRDFVPQKKSRDQIKDSALSNKKTFKIFINEKETKNSRSSWRLKGKTFETHWVDDRLCLHYKWSYF